MMLLKINFFSFPVVVFLSLCLATLLYVLSHLWIRIKIQRWRNHLGLDKHQNAFHQLYSNVNGFALSQQSRLKNNAIEFVYGEIEFCSYIALLCKMKLKQNTIFYDLGSGTGKAVLACAMVFNVQKSCGIELFKLLHHAALGQRQQLLKQPEYSHLNDKIEFIHSDFLKVDFSDATHIFINASAFIGETWRKLHQHLEKYAAKAIIATTSKPLDSPAFSLENDTRLQMSWGVVRVYIHYPIRQSVDNIE